MFIYLHLYKDTFLNMMQVKNEKFFVIKLHYIIRYLFYGKLYLIFNLNLYLHESIKIFKSFIKILKIYTLLCFKKICFMSLFFINEKPSKNNIIQSFLLKKSYNSWL